MNNISKYFDFLQAQICQQAPQCTITLKKMKEESCEGFFLKSSGKNMIIESNHSLAKAYALNKIMVGMVSGHLAEYLGRNEPSFSLRPVWFTDYDLTQFNQSKTEKVCKRLIQWGFNAIVINCKIEEFQNDIFFDTLAIFHSYNLKVILKPIQLHENNSRTKVLEWVECLNNQKICADYIWIEASFVSPVLKRMLKREIALKDVQLFEGILNKIPLIYYIPYVEGSENWLPDFLDDVSKSTVIAFPAAIDSNTPNPLWNKLRSIRDTSSTRMLPVINGGLVDKGNGLWPILPLQVLNDFISRCSRHHFAGAVIPAKYFPVEKGWLDAALWISGQCLWDKKSPALLAETWFKAYSHDFDYQSSAAFLNEMQWAAQKVCALQSLSASSEEGKVSAESLLSQLKLLKILAQSKKAFHLLDCFSCFERDVENSVTKFFPVNRQFNRESSNKKIEHVVSEDLF